MTWITTIPYERAEGRLKKLYDRIKGPNDNVDNIMLAHSVVTVPFSTYLDR